METAYHVSDEIKQQGVHEPNPQAERQDDERQREKQKDWLHHDIQQAQQEHHHEQRGGGIIADARHDLGAEGHAEGQHEPPHQQVDERMVH